MSLAVLYMLMHWDSALFNLICYAFMIDNWFICVVITLILNNVKCAFYHCVDRAVTDF